METSGHPDGRIITFYSYKGGTGRSMALANAAWLLALGGYRVLVIDWDVEAPGLHRYFRPFLDDPELGNSEGLIDFMVEFADVASEQQDPPLGWYIPYANLLRYAVPINYDFPGDGVLDIIPAGRQNADYAGRVNSFGWRDFYEKLSGWPVLDEARRRMREEYDYILIDSRTGVSDTAGVCTVQMPDALVVCWTLNLQSVHGASSAAALVLEKRAKRNDPIMVYPVPMRVDDNEKIKTTRMLDYAKPYFVKLLPKDKFKTEKQKDVYWGEVTVPYIPFYAFEENLTYFRDDPNSTRSVLYAVRRMLWWVTGLDLTLPALDETSKAAVTAAYDAISSTKQQIVVPVKTIRKPVLGASCAVNAPRRRRAASSLGLSFMPAPLVVSNTMDGNYEAAELPYPSTKSKRRSIECAFPPLQLTKALKRYSTVGSVARS